jgi:hypothetical protein
MSFNIPNWDEEGSPKAGDIVFLASRKIRTEKNKKQNAIYVYSFPFSMRFLDLNCLALIIDRSDFDNKIKCVILDGDTRVYETCDDIIDLKGIRWQQHNCHWKYRLIKRK